MKSRHINIPIFIPHLGCPNNCVFCNQKTISGRQFFDEGDVPRQIEEALSTVPSGTEAEIAFFGGSFTAIDRGLMVRLLDAAGRYLRDPGCPVSSLRCSTRPDAIDPETVRILKEYDMETVELGVQSMSDRVLALSKRGHTAVDSERAFALLREYGFRTVGQMMIGLPGSTADDERRTAEKICDMGADAARIYPTVVFSDTELRAMAERGEYVPVTDEEAASVAADLIEIFDARGVAVIRTGLCASENLASPEEVYGGASHPAIGEMAMSEVFFRREREALERLAAAGKLAGNAASVRISVPRGKMSQAVGQKRINIKKLSAAFPGVRVSFTESEGLSGYSVSASPVRNPLTIQR